MFRLQTSCHSSWRNKHFFPWKVSWTEFSFDIEIIMQLSSCRFTVCWRSSVWVFDVWWSHKPPVHFKSTHKLCRFRYCWMVCGKKGLLFSIHVNRETVRIPLSAHQVLKCSIATVYEPCFQVLAPLTKFGLSITPVALGIEELLPAAQLRSHTMSVLIRTCLVVSTLVVALAVPYFGKHLHWIWSVFNCNHYTTPSGLTKTIENWIYRILDGPDWILTCHASGELSSTFSLNAYVQL